jgi:hypothetical protein
MPQHTSVNAVFHDFHCFAQNLGTEGVLQIHEDTVREIRRLLTVILRKLAHAHAISERKEE